MATDTYTIGSGGDYATFNALLAAQVANTNDLVCRTLSGALTTANVTWVAPAFASMTIEPYSNAYRHRGVVGSQVGWIAHNLAFATNAGKPVAVDGLYCIGNLTWGLASGSAACTFQRCFQQSGSFAHTNSGTGTMTVAHRNNVHCSTSIISATNTNASGTLNYTAQHITARASGTVGITLTRSAGTFAATIENCAIFNASTTCFNYGSGITVTANNNASSDATADDAAGTGHLTGIVAAHCFADPASDLRLVSGSPLLGAGKSIAAIVDDVLRRPRRTSRDIGAFAADLWSPEAAREAARRAARLAGSKL